MTALSRIVSTSALVPIFERARAALAEARTVDEVKLIRDQAQAIQAYLHQQRASLEMQNDAAEIKVRAERRLGEMLTGMEKHPGAATPSHDVRTLPPHLADLGIGYMQSSRWQLIARVPETTFDELIRERKEQPDAELTTAYVLRHARLLAQPEAEVPLPAGKYRVIYADPPWRYGNTMPSYFAEQADHYPLMDLEEICALPVGDLAEDNAVLFLWTTSPMVEDAFKIIQAWGFEYKASFVWDKVRHNMGHYNSVRHEFLLVATRGSCPPEVPHLFDSVVVEERQDHSRKPETFYTIIETLYPSARKVELFARTRREGWDSHGNEI